MVLRLGRGEVVEYSLDHRRGELLRGQTVASSDDTHIAASRLVQCVDAIQVERLARAARLFGAIEHRDRLDARRESFGESLHVKRPIQPHLEHADFLSARRQIIDRLVRRIAARAHQHNHALGVRRAVVIEKPVSSSRQLGEAVHGALHEIGTCRVEGIHRLARLEINVRVLSRAAQYRMIRRERPRAVLANAFLIDHLTQHFVMRAPRFSPARATCGIRQKSAGRESAIRAWQPAR